VSEYFRTVNCLGNQVIGTELAEAKVEVALEPDGEKNDIWRASVTFTGVIAQVPLISVRLLVSAGKDACLFLPRTMRNAP
jgi:hypothetical protein